ncbi:MAG: hypothetical protein K8F91_03335 [Candidatus Obscuribacterales bacterium]|nr:hypothetical protein [Candidatus Obscuribacterales bacterium]
MTFIACGAHLAAMKESGLKIVRPDAPQICIEKPVATSDPAEVGAVDIVLFCVKLWDTQTAAELVKPMIGPDVVLC